ncbi:MAG: hypothetical protein HZA52_14295 [Planctomycetes bacterium]|nr:hypothetical protein [Planctomycetota bacterium]
MHARKPGGMAVRLSIGLGGPTDIIEDLKSAMHAVTKTSSKNGATKTVEPPKAAKA